MSNSLMAVRAISEAEAQVTERALTVASVTEDAIALSTQVRSLQVVGRCPCGCASVNFLQAEQGEALRMVADAVGEAPGGEHLGIIVWAVGDKLAELEIYNYLEHPAPLPTSSSIRPYDGIDLDAA